MTDERAEQAARDTERSNRKVATVSAAVAVGMLALAFASVPLYRLFCQVTGYGGTTQKAAAPSSVVVDRTVTVRFDANVSSGLAWRVEPLQRTIEIKLGETAVIAYRATNLSDKTIVGTSGFNVSPDITGSYFNKLECFCFTEQKLEPGQSLDMPVSFYVDPAMLADADARKVQQITLSYTFYRVEKPKTASASTGGRL